MSVKEFWKSKNYFQKGSIIGIISGLLGYFIILLFFWNSWQNTISATPSFYIFFILPLLTSAGGGVFFGFVGFLIGLIQKGLWKRFVLIVLIIIAIIIVWTVVTTPYAGDETSCNKDDDCVVTSYTYDCCGAPCGGAIINRQAFEKRKQWTIDNCGGEDYEKCPQVNCEDLDNIAICKNNQCQILNLEILTSVEECEKRDGGAKESCYAYFAQKLKDYSLCNKVQIEYKQECISQVQRAIKNE